MNINPLNARPELKNWECAVGLSISVILAITGIVVIIFGSLSASGILPFPPWLLQMSWMHAFNLGPVGQGIAWIASGSILTLVSLPSIGAFSGFFIYKCCKKIQLYHHSKNAIIV